MATGASRLARNTLRNAAATPHARPQVRPACGTRLQQFIEVQCPRSSFLAAESIERVREEGLDISFGNFAENLSLLEKFVGEEEGREIHVTHMRYEGNVPGGPFVVLKFDKPVQWNVTEGDSLRGMNIAIKES